MRTIQIAVGTISLLFSMSGYASYYVHIGGGLDRVSHNKSPKNYPMQNIKAGLGYTLSRALALELDVTANSTSTTNGTGTCITNTNVQVVCSNADEISRQLIAGSAVYTRKIKKYKFFAKAGIAAINSAYYSTIKSNLAGQEVLADKKHTGVAGLFDLGVLVKEKHRIGAIMSSNYGSSSVGTFSFVGIEYNYIISF